MDREDAGVAKRRKARSEGPARAAGEDARGPGAGGRDVAARVAVATLLALLVLTPLAVDPRGYNMYSLPKSALLLVASVVLLTSGAAARGFASMPARPRMLLGSLPVLAALSTAASQLPMVSLLGKFGRHEGLAELLSYVAVFLAARWALASTERVRLAQRLTLLPLACVSTYAILQRLGIDFAFSGGGSAAQRPWSFLGNASTMGAYAAMAVLVVAPLVLDRHPAWRAAAASCSLLGLTALWLSGSRGAWLGFAAGACVSLVVAARERRRRLIRYLGAALVLSAVLLAPSIAPRLGAEGWAGRTVTGRLALWQRVGALSAQRPLLGWGPETLEYVFPRAVDERWASAMPDATVVDNAHLLPLHVAYASGVPAALALLALGGAAALASWRRSRSPDPPGPHGELLAACCAYAVALLFHPSLPHVTSVWAAYAGAASVFAWSSQAEAGGATRESRAAGRATGARVAEASGAGSGSAAMTAIPLALALAGMWVGGMHARTIQADHLLRSAMEAEASFDLSSAGEQARRAQLLAPHEAAYGRYAAGVLLKRYELTDDARALAEVRAAANEAVEANPLDALSWRLLAASLAEETDGVPPIPDLARNATARAEGLDPFGVLAPSPAD